MTTYKIPCIWTMRGDYCVEAATEEEAIQKAYDGDLPDGEYINDSFEVVKED